MQHEPGVKVSVEFDRLSENANDNYEKAISFVQELQDLGPDETTEAKLEADLLRMDKHEYTNIFGTSASCMAALETLIKEQHPMEQAAGQSRANFLDSVVEACGNAEMDNLTTDQLMVHIVLSGLTDQDPREKLHELVDPSIKELRQATKRLDHIKLKVSS